MTAYDQAIVQSFWGAPFEMIVPSEGELLNNSKLLIKGAVGSIQSEGLQKGFSAECVIGVSCSLHPSVHRLKLVNLSRPPRHRQVHSDKGLRRGSQHHPITASLICTAEGVEDFPGALPSIKCLGKVAKLYLGRTISNRTIAGIDKVVLQMADAAT